MLVSLTRGRQQRLWKDKDDAASCYALRGDAVGPGGLGQAVHAGDGDDRHLARIMRHVAVAARSENGDVGEQEGMSPKHRREARAAKRGRCARP